MSSGNLGPYAGPAVRLGTVVRWAFRALFVLVLVQLVFSGWVLGLIDSIESPATRLQLSRIGDWMVFAALAMAVLLVVAAILFLVWQYQAARAVAMRRDIETPPISPGGHVGWWFVPFANLVMVPKAIGQLVRASTAGPGRRWSDESFPEIVLGWWLLFLAGSGLGRLAARKMEVAFSVRRVADALWIDVAATVLTLLAIVLLLRIVKDVCTAQAAWPAPGGMSEPVATPAT